MTGLSSVFTEFTNLIPNTVYPEQLLSGMSSQSHNVGSQDGWNGILSLVCPCPCLCPYVFTYPVPRMIHFKHRCLLSYSIFIQVLLGQFPLHPLLYLPVPNEHSFRSIGSLSGNLRAFLSFMKKFCVFFHSSQKPPVTHFLLTQWVSSSHTSPQRLCPQLPCLGMGFEAAAAQVVFIYILKYYFYKQFSPNVAKMYYLRMYNFPSILKLCIFSCSISIREMKKNASSVVKSPLCLHPLFYFIEALRNESPSRMLPWWSAPETLSTLLVTMRIAVVLDDTAKNKLSFQSSESGACFQ